MLNPVRPENIALVLCACLLSFAPSVQAVSAGAPPPPPTWSLGEIDEPLTIPQEGVIVLHAVYEMYGFWTLGEGDATYTVTVSAQDGEEIAGEATYTHERSTLTWRAAAPPLEPSDALTIHLELINILPAVDEDIVRDIALVVSDSATPELIGAEIVHHVPTTGANRVNGLPGMPGYTCQAPNSAIKWAPATALPTWMHRLLSYNVALVTADDNLRIAVNVDSFANNLTYFT